MYQHILIATDGSELASWALTHGLALAKEVKAPVTLVTVTQPWSAFDMAHKAREGNRDPMRQFDAIAAAWAKSVLDAAGQKAKTAGVARRGGDRGAIRSCIPSHRREVCPTQRIAARARSSVSGSDPDASISIHSMLPST